MTRWKRRGLLVIAILIVAKLCFWGAIVAWQVSDRALPIDFVIAKVLPVNGPFCPGGLYELDVSTHYVVAAGVHASRSLTDASGKSFALTDWNRRFTPTGMIHTNTPYRLPAEVAHGDATITTHPEYFSNWFQRLFWPVRAPDRVIPFRIEEKC